jgi:hypothetical protein
MVWSSQTENIGI